MRRTHTLISLSALFGVGLLISFTGASLFAVLNPGDLRLPWPGMFDVFWSLLVVVVCSTVFGAGLRVFGNHHRALSSGSQPVATALVFGACAFGLIYFAGIVIFHAVREPPLLLLGSLTLCIFFFLAALFVRIVAKDLHDG